MVGVADEIAKVANLSPLNVRIFAFPVFRYMAGSLAEDFKKSLESSPRWTIGNENADLSAAKQTSNFSNCGLHVS